MLYQKLAMSGPSPQAYLDMSTAWFKAREKRLLKRDTEGAEEAARLGDYYRKLGLDYKGNGTTR